MRLLAGAAIVAFLLDQISKYLVVHVLQLWRVYAIDVLPPVLNFRYGENRGINFGLFDSGSDGMRWFLILLSVGVVSVVVVWVLRTGRGWPMQLSAGLLAGGALGNVLDRLVYGYVLDFLNTSCCGIDNPFTFNVGDIFIFAGAAGLIFFDRARHAA